MADTRRGKAGKHPQRQPFITKLHVDPILVPSNPTTDVNTLSGSSNDVMRGMCVDDRLNYYDNDLTL